MVVDGGTYTSNGTGSPAIYSTADIAVKDATLTATGSEAVCIEGLNSIRLFNSDLTGNIPANSQNDCDWNVILYQSMSGDSQVGNSTFEMQGGTWQYTTVTSEDTLSKTLTGLKSGKTYQIKVRAYENVNGEKVYGSYSTIKKVKCK